MFRQAFFTLFSAALIAAGTGAALAQGPVPTETAVFAGGCFWCDAGTPYRTAIYAQDDAQMKAAEASKAEIDKTKPFKAPIVTEVVPLHAFHEAETYHHDYAARNPEQGYIVAVAQPKVDKLRQKFADRLKKPS